LSREKSGRSLSGEKEKSQTVTEDRGFFQKGRIKLKAMPRVFDACEMLALSTSQRGGAKDLLDEREGQKRYSCRPEKIRKKEARSCQGRPSSIIWKSTKGDARKSRTSGIIPSAILSHGESNGPFVKEKGVQQKGP